MIQKNIFQTFYSKKLPDPITEIINFTKNNNKNYKYNFFDDNDIIDFIKTEYDSEIFYYYSKLQVGAAKADFWRYLVLYKFGGVYLDLDSLINIPIDDIIKNSDKSLITRENNIGSFVQWAMFYEKKHIILEKTINAVIKNIRNYKKEQLDLVTGPPVLSKVIEEHYSYLNLNNTLYHSKDDDINKKLSSSANECDRFFGIDYNGFATFKHQFNFLLYPPFMEKIGWKKDKTNLIK